MAPLTTTRTLFELRVGSFHTIEVLLQIRPSDISWWNSDLSNNERQLYKLLGRRILPQECANEIEAYRTKRKERDNATKNNTDKKKKKGEVVIGGANLKKKKATEKGKNAGKKRGGKKKETKASKKQKLSDKSKDADSKDKKLPKLLREPGKWVMGKSIQICKLFYSCVVVYFYDIVFNHD